MKKKQTKAEAAAAAILAKRPTIKVGTPQDQQFGSKNVKAKPPPKPEVPRGHRPKVDDVVRARQHEEELAYRAKRWAELHASPKTRDKMDTQLEGLSAKDQRRVYLNGMRIAAGFNAKH
jgi:hypothetical protein